MTRARWLKTGALVGALVVLVMFIATARLYARLCEPRPLDLFPVLSGMRQEAELHAAAPGDGAGMSEVRAGLARAEAGLLATLLPIKQSDALAFPAHAAAARALEMGGCPAASSGDQWRKAAPHAWSDEMAAWVAKELARALGRDVATEHLRADAERGPWYASRLRTVIAHLAE